MNVTRPALRYHGGKWLLAPWIMGFFPQHRLYVEAFGGAASVLLRKPRSYAEIYNDLDDEVVQLFQVLRDPDKALELRRLLELTPFARKEFVAAYKRGGTDVEISRKLIVRSFMGFGSDGINNRVATGFRANSNRSGTTPAHDWAAFPPALAAVAQRMAGVTIECRPAMQVAQHHDSPETLHYLDPPYLPATRSQKMRRGGGLYHGYKHEMTIEDHAQFLADVQNLTGMVVISGYHSPMYDDALAGWDRHERETHADGARDRVEVLWLNKACAVALGHGPLFQEAS